MPQPDIREAIARVSAAADALESCRTRCIHAWESTIAESEFEGRHADEITGKFNDTVDRLARVKGALDDRRAVYERELAEED